MAPTLDLAQTIFVVDFQIFVDNLESPIMNTERRYNHDNYNGNLLSLQSLENLGMQLVSSNPKFNRANFQQLNRPIKFGLRSKLKLEFIDVRHVRSDIFNTI